MNIKNEPLYEIHQLLAFKNDVGSPDKFTYMEVLEIETQTCYAGTQIFYRCRLSSMEKIVYRDKAKEVGVPRKFKDAWISRHGVSNSDNQIGWQRYREDELVELPKHKLKIINEARQQV